MFNYKIRTEMVSQKRGNLCYDIHYPVIEKPDGTATASINNFSKFAAGEFEKFIHSSIVPAAREKEGDFSVARVYRLMYSSRFIISYKYEINSYDNKMNRINLVSGATWNTRTGSLVRLGDFFRKNVRYREMILYILSGKIKQRIADGENFFDDWNARLYAFFKTENYYLCTEGMVFYFPYGALKPNEDRPSEYMISFMELKNQIRTEIF